MAWLPWCGGKLDPRFAYRLSRLPVFTTWFFFSTRTSQIPLKSSRSTRLQRWHVCSSTQRLFSLSSTRSVSTSCRRDRRLLEYALKRSVRDNTRKGKGKTEAKETEPEITTALIIDEKGVNLGSMNVAEARALAASQGMHLDLVYKKEGESAVMRFREKKEWHERQSKKRREEEEERKMLAAMKEIRITTSIAEHDLEVRLKKIRSFLKRQLPVEVHVQLPKSKTKLTSKELQEIQHELLDRTYRTVEDIAVKSRERHLPQMTLCAVFTPKPVAS